MISALASASELLASHCVELAELSGAGHDRVVSAVRSAVDVRGPGDLLTLTAAAATGKLITEFKCCRRFVCDNFKCRLS